ncbi:cysteine synthase A [Alkalimarinus alittae]|uniref:Cysteine synthase n=1 Tax=Alkalimarinus alittae TaxID=2961619 RepID=A0ABY6N6T5_9ALTE|nr:cysteine synthase A [Alkalimarinus alittae]UZE97801.1 cysteine synthase A [Alkalimarinus alittae]
MARIYNDNTLSIGNTPLVKLNRVTKGNVFAKIESRNPASSVKCRIGASMVWDAEQSGKLKAGMILVEPTSGNTGIALAFVAASRGYKLILTMPSSMSLERRKVVKALGAEVVLTDPAKGMNGAIAKASEIVAAHPDDHLMLQQFENPANPRIHEETTGPEIWNDTDGGIDILVAGVGTGGTISGISRYIKKTKGKQIISIAVEPESSPIISQTLNSQALTHAPHKLQGIGPGFIPANLDLEMIDSAEQVSNEDAMTYAHRLMKEEGILAGISSGAAVAVACRVAEQHPEKNIVVIIPDSAERYLSSPLFEDYFSENETVQ